MPNMNELMLSVCIPSTHTLCKNNLPKTDKNSILEIDLINNVIREIWNLHFLTYQMIKKLFFLLPIYCFLNCRNHSKSKSANIV
jgi:hypothetical protein